MNYNNKLKLIQTKPKVQWWAIFAIFGLVLTFSACEKDDECIVVEDYPSLTLSNQNTNDYWITAVKLVDYEFYNLQINSGESQTFALDGGMPGGYNDINVKVYYSRGTPNGSRSIKVNFNNGENTTITLKGCISYEGCDGFYLE